MLLVRKMTRATGRQSACLSPNVAVWSHWPFGTYASDPRFILSCHVFEDSHSLFSRLAASPTSSPNGGLCNICTNSDVVP